jgi:hypothetical protein
MNPAVSVPRRWTLGRWLLALGIVFAGQVGLIFLLGEHSVAPARTRGPAPGFRLVSPTASEWLALVDPTLFALPHQQGFSGKAWLHPFSQKLPSFDLSQSPEWLPLPVSEFGRSFDQFMETNQAGAMQPLAVAESELTVPEIASQPVLPVESSLRREGGLAKRQLAKPIPLKSWAHETLLTNTVVHLFVNANGRTFSPTLLPPGSGLKEADQYALEQARAALFAPIPPRGPQAASNPPPQLTSGELIFQWHTVPLPPTNPPPPVVSP